MRLATDFSVHRPDVPVVPLLQFAAEGHDTGETPWERRFEPLVRAGAEHFELTDLDRADLVVIPTDWYWVRGSSWASRPDRGLARRLRTLHELARDAGTPTAVFFTGDRSCDRVGLPGAHVFREGAFRSRLTPFDHPMPAFAEDLLAAYCGGHIVEREREDRPVVGFCGLASSRSPFDRAVRLVLYRLVVAARERRIDPSPYLGELMRHDALEQLERSDRVATNFVLRDSSVFFRDASAAELTDVRQEYVDNLISSDYVLCIRGSGNYSFRLYETLSMGRIPVIVDTDLALPLPEEIPWREVCVWVPKQERHHIGELIAERHDRLSDEEFVAAQHRARRVWVEHLSPVGYFSRLADLVAAR